MSQELPPMRVKYTGHVIQTETRVHTEKSKVYTIGFQRYRNQKIIVCGKCEIPP